MVCCAAWGCSNRSEKGVKMYGFPTELERRKKWVAKVSRSDLKINQDYNYKKLCEAHFEADQFVRTPKGKTRLKKDAIPTVFVHRPVAKKRRSPTPRCTTGHVTTTTIAVDHSYSLKDGKDPKIEERRDEVTERMENESEEKDIMASEERRREPSQPSQPTASEPADSQSNLLKTLKRQEEITKKAKAALRKMRRENAALKKTLKIRDHKIKKTFSKDQIKALGRLTTKGMKWSNETIEKALKIRFAAGPAAYKTLQELEIPLPGIRTLQRRMQCVKFEKEQHLTGGHFGNKSKSKKATRNNSSQVSTSGNSQTALQVLSSPLVVAMETFELTIAPTSAPAPSQHPANTTASPLTSTQPASLLCSLTEHHLSPVIMTCSIIDPHHAAAQQP